MQLGIASPSWAVANGEMMRDVFSNVSSPISKL
jgi:hypothetical protein